MFSGLAFVPCFLYCFEYYSTDICYGERKRVYESLCYRQTSIEEIKIEIYYLLSTIFSQKSSRRVNWSARFNRNL